MRLLSIIIPVYNEKSFIGHTVKKVIKANSCGFKKEIIAVDDGSTDNTLKILKKLQKKFKRKRGFSFTVISKKKNSGKGSVLKEGFLASKGDLVLVQDGDAEYSPDDYPILLEPFIKSGADVVYGSRFVTNKPHRVLYFWHSVANSFITNLSNLFTNLNLTDIETGYKVFRGDLIRKLAKGLISKRFGFEVEITAKIAKIKELRIYEVGISYWGRTYKEGKKIGLADGLKAIFEIIRFNLMT